MVSSWVLGRPAPALRRHVTGYVGYRTWQPSGVHRGLPSGSMTFIVGIGSDIEVLEHVEPSLQSPSSHGIVVGGLHTRPALIARGGLEEGVAVDLSPLGARVLLGRPAADLAGLTVGGEEVLGRVAAELRERLEGVAGWRDRFAVLDAVLSRRVDEDGSAHPAVTEGWRLLQASAGRIEVGVLARELGWSRRHLTTRFRAELGLAPKAAARALRFSQAVSHLRQDPSADLATIAALTGYYDQAHLTRDFRDLAGCPPSQWLREEFPSVQDAVAG